jgi:hypothetical protein
MNLIRPVTLSILALMLAGRAHADIPDLDSAVAHMGIGAGITFNKPTNNDGNSARGVAFVYRWHSFHSGWGPTFGIDWHSTDYNSANAPFGTLRTRALLAGYGHTKKIGRFSASASMSAGYSFNDFSVASAAGPTFASAGVTLLGVSVGNSAVLKPEVAAWYDVFRHVGIGVSAAYLVTRPSETLTTATGTQVLHLRGDEFELTAGVTVGVWKKR